MSLYDSLYTLIAPLFESAVSEFPELVVQIIAASGTLFVIALPFALVFFAIRSLLGR